MNAAATTTTDQSLLTSAATKELKTDFPDWLSPVLVKELRQGLRTKMFTGMFITLHAVMVLMVSIWSLMENQSSDSEFLTGLFWTLTGFVVLLGMPSRGLTALQTEQKAQTLELVQMSELTSFRIVFGKWLAIALQTVLLVVSVLPYALLRYFFGRVDVMEDAQVLGWMLAGSLVLTAFAVAASVLGAVARGLIIFGVIFFGNYAGVIFAFSRFGGGGMFGGVSSVGGSAVLTYVFTALLMAAYTWLALEEAATFIAPISENHASRKRAGALVVLGLVVAAGLLGGTRLLEIVAVWATPFLAWVCVGALLQMTSPLPVIYRPWTRRGVPGTLAGKFLYPGWATGVLFLVGTTLGFCGFLFWLNPPSRDVDLRLWLGLANLILGLLSPLPFLILFKTKAKFRVWAYIFFQALCCLAAAITVGLSSFNQDGAARVFAFLPTSLLFIGSNESDPVLLGYFSIVTMITGTVILGFLGVHMLREFRFISRMEALSRGEKGTRGVG